MQQIQQLQQQQQQQRIGQQSSSHVVRKVDPSNQRQQQQHQHRPQRSDGNSRLQQLQRQSIRHEAGGGHGISMFPVVTSSSPETAHYRHSNSSESSQASSQSSQSKLPVSERLRRGIFELLETERTYVGHLRSLLDTYVQPLRLSIFPTHSEVQQLAETTQQILGFQAIFLQSLEEAVRVEPDLMRFADASQFRRILFVLSGSFLYHAEHFKLYSSFCACHSKCQKLMNPEENSILREFLLSKNPHQEQSSAIDSFLIKPIQRILKYPLLLQNLCTQAIPGSEEQKQLLEALHGMETVAEHINEMQKIYEEYGPTFEELTRIFKEVHPNKRPVDLGIGDLQMYGTVEWLNASDNLGKIKKNIDLYTTCFVFKSAVVMLCRERARTKRKNSKPNLLTQISGGQMGIGDLVRFQTVIPVAEVEVRCGFTSEADSMHLWELVHMRSDTEKRPEKVYQLSNCSSEARNDFLKTIRQMIRDCVRQMSLPSLRSATSTPPQLLEHQQQRQRQQFDASTGAETGAKARPRPQPPMRTTSQLSGTAQQQQQRHSGQFNLPPPLPPSPPSLTSAADRALSSSLREQQLKARSRTCSDLQEAGRRSPSAEWEEQDGPDVEEVIVAQRMPTPPTPPLPPPPPPEPRQLQQQQQQLQQEPMQLTESPEPPASEYDNCIPSPPQLLETGGGAGVGAAAPMAPAAACGSSSTLSTLNSGGDGSGRSPSARLLFASGTPLRSSALTVGDVSGGGGGDAHGTSPIWKPRSRVTYDTSEPTEVGGGGGSGSGGGGADRTMSAATAYSDYTGLAVNALPGPHLVLCQQPEGITEEGVTQL